MHSQKKNINEDRLEKKKRRREIKKFFDKNKKKILENNGEIDDMSYLELDEEEEYDLMCKFEDYYMKHIEKQENKKKKKEKQEREKQEREKQTIKPKRTFARSKFNEIVESKNKKQLINSIPTINYY